MPSPRKPTVNEEDSVFVVKFHQISVFYRWWIKTCWEIVKNSIRWHLRGVWLTFVLSLNSKQCALCLPFKSVGAAWCEQNQFQFIFKFWFKSIRSFCIWKKRLQRYKSSSKKFWKMKTNVEPALIYEQTNIAV